jgi:hypothetical protein
MNTILLLRIMKIMKYILSFFVFLLVCIKCYSQNINTVFHPVVGDTISLEEKQLYLVFDEIPYKNFVFGVLSIDNDEYKLTSHYVNDTIVTMIDSLKIVEYRKNIDKIYSSLHPTKDNIPDNIVQNTFIQKNKDVNLNVLTPKMKKQIGNEAMRYQILNNSADNQGLIGEDKKKNIQTGGGGSIRLKKKKK